MPKDPEMPPDLRIGRMNCVFEYRNLNGTATEDLFLARNAMQATVSDHMGEGKRIDTKHLK